MGGVVDGRPQWTQTRHNPHERDKLMTRCKKGRQDVKGKYRQYKTGMYGLPPLFTVVSCYKEAEREMPER